MMRGEWCTAHHDWKQYRDSEASAIALRGGLEFPLSGEVGIFEKTGESNFLSVEGFEFVNFGPISWEKSFIFLTKTVKIFHVSIQNLPKLPKDIQNLLPLI